MNQEYGCQQQQSHHYEQGEEADEGAGCGRQGRLSLHPSSSFLKRPLPTNNSGDNIIRPGKEKRQRTIIAMEGIRAVVATPPETSRQSVLPSPHPPLGQPEHEDCSMTDSSSSSSSGEEVDYDYDDDQLSSTSSQDTVPPPSEAAAPPLERNDERGCMDTTVVAVARVVDEKHIMDNNNKLDLRDNSLQEEKGVMQYLWKQVCKAEEYEYIQSLPGLIKDEDGEYRWGLRNRSPGQMSLRCNIPDSWNLRKRRRRLRRRSSVVRSEKNWATTGNHHSGNSSLTNNDDIHSKAEDILRMECKTLRQSLPKYISTRQQPQSMGDRARLFTRTEFMKQVVAEIEKTLPPYIRHNSCLWSVSISEEHPDDAGSYMLQARVPEMYLELLREKVQEFVRRCLWKENRKLLLGDDSSIFVDVALSLKNAGSLGLTLARNYKFDDENEGSGTLITKANPESLFCKILGGPMAYGDGCVLLAINNKEVTSPHKATVLIKQALHDESQQQQNGEHPGSKVTVCLSRSASFEQSCDQSALTVRDRDGDLLDSESDSDSEMRLRRYLDRMGPVEPCWVDYCHDATATTTMDADMHIPTSKSEVAVAYSCIAKDPQSVEIELTLSAPDGSFGAKIDEIPGKGLYLRLISKKKPLGKALGEAACRCGGILRKVNADVVKTKAELEDALESAGLSFFTVTLWMLDGTDLSSVQRDKIVYRKPNPRRRNGNPYPIGIRQNNARTKDVDQFPTKASKKKSKLRARTVFVDSDEDDSLHSTATKTPLQRFQEFEGKFRRLVRLDYRDTKIHTKLVTSSLWSKHKKMFGEGSSCDKNCRCIDFLPELESNVLDDCLRRQKRSKTPLEPRSVLQQYVPGIMKHFSLRFMPKLRETYKNETPEQLLDRLCNMWAFHIRSRQYGVHCGENCSCEGEWDQLFGKGDTAAAETFWEISSMSWKKRTPSLDTSATSEPIMQVASIPRKRRGSMASSHGAGADGAPLRTIAAIPRKAPHGQNSASTSGVEIAVTYEVAFDTSTPLGGYFATCNHTNGLPFVEVKSVYPLGQMARNRRVRPGACVQAVLAGENRNSVASHKELEARFEVARRHRRPLKLILINQGSGLVRNHEDDNWNSIGEWTGGSSDGWAGGAVDHSLKTEKVAPTASHQQESIIISASRIEPKQEIWRVQVHRKALPDLAFANPVKSCLKLSSTASSSKRVKFAKGCQKKIVFDGEYPSNTEVVRQAVDDVSDGMQEAPKISQIQQLSDAVRTGSCEELVKVLQSGINFNAELVKTVLKSHYDSLKKERSLMNATSISSSVNDLERKRDLDSKCAVLKVYISCSYQIEKAMSLTKWYQLHIRVLQINITKINGTAFGRTCVGRVVINHGKGEGTKEVLGSLPVKSLAGVVSYDSTGSIPFVAKNNATFGMEDRELMIEINEGYHGEIMPARRFGTAIYDLDEIERSCPLDDERIEVTRPLRSECDVGNVGEAKISVSKQRVGPEYVNQKRAEILVALKTQMDSIKKYNIDAGRRSGEKLSGNIQGINGLSLLHAAVHLGESGSLIHAMLDLGVDPRLKSRLGTPLHFAQQQLDRALEKEKNLEAKGSSHEDLARQREKCRQVKELVELLQNATPAPLFKGDDTGINVVKVTSGSQTGSADRKIEGRQDDQENSSASIGSQEVSTTDPKLLNNTVPRQHSAISLPRSDSGPDRSSDLMHSRLAFKPNLPNLPSVEWAPLLGRTDKRCANNLKGCYHFRTRSCHYWHDVLSPLQQNKMDIVPPLVPRLNPNFIALKEERHLWTAVYADTRSKRFIHAQNVFKKGFTSPQGISWFTSRGDAEAALERTVAVLLELDGPPPPRQVTQNYRKSDKFGRRRK